MSTVGERSVETMPAPSNSIPPEAPDADLTEALRLSEARVTVLEEQARRDPLTGLMNRRAFSEALTTELGRAERGSYPVTLAALDVDGFKQINDRFGHPVGDQVLCALAELLAVGVRPGDLYGRIGGDEFLVAFVGLGPELAEETVARLTAAAASIKYGPYQEWLSVSAGVAVFPEHARDRTDLIACADAALYQAKASGRARAYVATTAADACVSGEEQQTERDRLNLQNAVGSLARALDARNGETHRHSPAVAAHAATLASALGMDRERVEEVRCAGVLHDVGKIGIPDTILKKQGPLSEAETTVMRRHATLGQEIVAGAGLPEVADWVGHLHERFDGSGYPDGLGGEDIPLESRVLHVAEAIDAMTSKRSYRDPLTGEETLDELRRCTGTQFDPQVASLVEGFTGGGGLRLTEPGASPPTRKPTGRFHRSSRDEPAPGRDLVGIDRPVSAPVRSS